MRSSPPFDQVTLVNERDEVVGAMDKIDAHRGGGTLHRAASVMLLNSRSEILLQQRSNNKIVGAGQWANTCCGNVRPTETYETCAVRRLREELGIEEVVLRPLVKFQYFAACNREFVEKEIDQIYIGHFNGDPVLNPDEVQACRWVNWTQFLQEWQTVREKNPARLQCQTDANGELGLAWQFPGEKASVTISPWFIQILELEEVRAL